MINCRVIKRSVLQVQIVKTLELEFQILFFPAAAGNQIFSAERLLVSLDIFQALKPFHPVVSGMEFQPENTAQKMHGSIDRFKHPIKIKQNDVNCHPKWCEI